MRIQEILKENIFTTDYHMVMDAVARLYDQHYEVNIWEQAEAHDEAAKVLLKQHPTREELEFIIKTGELPERLREVDFPINDSIMWGVSKGEQSVDEGVEEAQASKKLCQSSRSDASLGASNLASCKSQGYRARDGKKSHKIGNKRVTVGDKKIKGKAHGGPLPDWS